VGGYIRGERAFPYWGFFVESKKFREQIRELENNQRESRDRDLCTLCGESTRGESDRVPNGVGWVNGWVHKDCVKWVCGESA